MVQKKDLSNLDNKTLNLYVQYNSCANFLQSFNPAELTFRAFTYDIETAYKEFHDRVMNEHDKWMKLDPNYIENGMTVADMLHTCKRLDGLGHKYDLHIEAYKNNLYLTHQPNRKNAINILNDVGILETEVAKMLENKEIFMFSSVYIIIDVTIPVKSNIAILHYLNENS